MASPIYVEFYANLLASSNLGLYNILSLNTSSAGTIASIGDFNIQNNNNIGFLIDIDSQKVTIYRNGVVFSDNTVDFKGKYDFQFSLSIANSCSIFMNAGQAPFKYQKSGAISLNQYYSDIVSNVSWKPIGAVSIDGTGYLATSSSGTYQTAVTSPTRVGQQTTSPDAGWKRIKDTDPRIMYLYTNIYGEVHYNAGKISFTFYGTKLRLIYNNNIAGTDIVTIDGVAYPSLPATNTGSSLLFEVTGLKLGLHNVVITTYVGSSWYSQFNALEVDSIGYLVTPIGSVLTAPDDGWQRHDDSHAAFKYKGTWTVLATSSAYNGAYTKSTVIGSTVSFRFLGSKLRIVSPVNTDLSKQMTITIDGVSEDYSIYNSSLIWSVLVYEKSDLSFGDHTVTITANTTAINIIDAIDIDSTGRIFHPDEVTDVSKLSVGKRIRMHYSAFNGTYGSISRVGLGTSNFIPSVSSATTTALPDGDFYAICVDGENFNSVLMPDRNIQCGISWDSLNGIKAATSELELKEVTGLGYFTSVIYVDPTNGTDTNEGSMYLPVKTLNQAISLSNVGGVVKLSGGIHIISIGNLSLNDLVTTKGLSFVGFGKDTVIEVPNVPQNYVQPYGTSAYFYNMIIRPTNTCTGDNRMLWFTSNTAEGNFKLRFKNVGFTKSVNNSYPTSWHFAWSGSGAYNPNVVFNNCSFVSVPSAVEINGGSVLKYTNCAFGNTNGGSVASSSTSCLFGVTFDNSISLNIASIGWKNTGTGLNSDGTKMSIGVYGGEFVWGIFDLNAKTGKSKIFIRLPSGGSDSNETISEWYKYVVSNTLLGSITAGDNSIWNWNNSPSWTSTSTSSSTSKVIRGGASAKAWSTLTSADASINAGFRPLILFSNSISADIPSTLNIYSDNVQLDPICFGNFNGINQYVDAAMPSAFNVTSGTIEALVNTTNAGTGYRAIAGMPYRFLLFMQDNILGIYDWGGTNSYKSTGINIADGKQHHVAVTFQNGVNNATTIYLDGNPVLTTSVTLLSNATTFQIGVDINTQFFSGQIGEVRYWNVVRTREEIVGSNGSQLTGGEAGLIGYWSFSNTKVVSNITYVTDLSNTKSDGKIFNGISVNCSVSRAAQIKSKIKILNRSDLTGSITVKPSGMMKARVGISPIYSNDLYSKISVKNVSDLLSTITIPPSGRMTARIDVQPPPTITLSLIPADSFVRSQVPRLNYGEVGDLLIGYDSDSNEFFRTFMRFDLGPIPSGMKILSSTLRIYSDIENGIDRLLMINNLSAEWTEKGITWKNQPSETTNITSFSVGNKKGYYEVDLTTVTKEWYLNFTPNNGFIIKAFDESLAQISRFYSKEQTFNNPLLVVKYLNPKTPTADVISLSSSILVRQNKLSQVKGSITIRSNRGEENLVSSIHVRNYNYMLESSITISRETMASKIVVRRQDDSILESSIRVAQRDISEVNSFILINGNHLKSRITVRRVGINDLFNCSITIRANDKSEINTTISISRPDLYSTIRVYKTNSLPCSIVVNSKSQLNSKVVVRRNETKDFPSAIRVFNHNNLTGSVFVVSGYLKSSIYVPYRGQSDMVTYMTVRKFFVSDMPSTIKVGNIKAQIIGAYVFIM